MTNHKRRRPQPPPPDPDSHLADDEGLWVRSEIDPITGAYMVSVSFDADHAWVLNRDQALRYAVAAVAAAQRAEYDAAVFALLTKRLKLDENTAGQVVVVDLRPDRPDPDTAATAPLTFTPGMTQHGKPFLTIELNGEPAGQLDPPALREHAMVVLEAPFAADLDAGLLRWLRKTGIDDARARNVVEDIANFRDVRPSGARG